MKAGAAAALRGALQAVIDDERRALTEELGRPPRRRELARRVAQRAAEIGVNAFFPTNGSGNNMSRG